MLSRIKRNKNKAEGPWGQMSFNFTYRRVGEEMKRNRFITAENKELAIEQFNAVMEKFNILASIIEIEEVEISQK